MRIACAGLPAGCLCAHCRTRASHFHPSIPPNTPASSRDVCVVSTQKPVALDTGQVLHFSNATVDAQYATGLAEGRRRQRRSSAADGKIMCSISSVTSATAPFTHTTAKGWKGVSASDSAVAAFGVPGRDARTCTNCVLY